MRVYTVKRITITADRLKHLEGDEYEVISFKRAVIDCHVKHDPPIADPSSEGPFKLILDWRGHTLVVATGRVGWTAGEILRDLKFALKRMVGEDVIHLPAHWDSDDHAKSIACGVEDAERIAGLLHTLRDVGGWKEYKTPMPRFGSLDL